MNSDIPTVCAAAVKIYGDDNQILKCIEEMSELTKELCKCLTGGRQFEEDDICEEIADVEIMIEQMRFIFNSGLINKYLNKKIKRLEKNIDSISKMK